MRFTKKERAILYEAMDLYCIEFCKSLPTDEELSHITFSEEFEQKMHELIYGEKKKKLHFAWLNTAGKRAAAIILVIILGLATITFSVKALREPIIRFIVETFEKFSNVIFISDKNEDDIIGAYSFEKVIPAYIPEGYVLDFEIDNESIYQARYFSSDKTNMFIYMQAIGDEGIIQANTENVSYTEIEINNHKAVSYNNKGTNTIILSINDYVFTIEGTINMEELIKIAESIKIN